MAVSDAEKGRVRLQMTTIRAKFRVTHVLEGMYTRTMDYSKTPYVPLAEPITEKHSEAVTMMPVYSPDPNDENHTFWKATPSGMLTMYIDNPLAWGKLVEGQEYYVDFTLAEKDVRHDDD